MLTAQLVKKHLVVDHCDDDEIIRAYWDAAIEFCEGRMGGPIVLKERIRYFEQLCELYLGDRVTQIVAVTWTDADGAPQILPPDDYRLILTVGGWCVSPLTQWPISYGTVTVAYIAGYGNVPPAIDQAVLMMIGHLYTNREAAAPVTVSEIPLAVDDLLRPYARFWL